MAFTKYNQLACDICKVEPPLGQTGICYRCSQGLKPVEFKEPEPEGQSVAIENVGTTTVVLKSEETAAPASNRLAKPVDDLAKSLKQMSRAELEAILSAPATTEEEQRRKRLARSRLWHLKQKDKS